MDSNCKPSQLDTVASPGLIATGPDPNANLEWRSQLLPESRHRIIDKIMDVLKRHLPSPASDNLSEITNIAMRFEEKIYNAATSQPDYLRRISLKMLSLEKPQGPQNLGANPNLQNQNRMDPGAMQSQSSTNPSQSLAIPAGRQMQQQQTLIPRNFQNNNNNSTGLNGPLSANVPTSLNQPARPNGPLPLSANMYANNSQRRQQLQQIQNQNPLYQQMLRQRMQQNQMQMSSGMSMTAGMSGVMQAQHNQLNLLQQQQQSLLRQQQNQAMSLQQRRMLMQPQPQLNNMNNYNINNKNMNNYNMNSNNNMMQLQPIQQQRNNNINNNNMMMQQRSAAMMQTQYGNNINNVNNNNANNININNNISNNINNNNVLDQQKQQFMQQQRIIQDVVSSPASMDLTAQTSAPNELLVEEMFQKVKSMKEQYSVDLREIYHRVSQKIIQIEQSPMVDARAAEHCEKMKAFKNGLEKMLSILQLNKQSLHHQVNMKRLQAYEKQIISIIQSHKRGPPPQHQQQPPLQQQQQQQQQQQLHVKKENVENQNHQMPANFNGLQNQDPVQNNGNNFNGMSSPQTAGSNISLKQQQMMQAQIKQRHMQQLMMQKQQQQQQQQNNNNINNNNNNNNNNQTVQSNSTPDIKPRIGTTGLKPNPYQPLNQGMGSRAGYHHPQIKPGNNLPITSPQNQTMQTLSPRVPLFKTPSPPVAPSPIIPDETKPSSMHNNSFGVGQTGQMGQQQQQGTSVQVTGQTGQSQSLATGTTGISASPLLAEFTSPETGQMGHGNNISTQVSAKPSVTESPIQRLVKALRAGSLNLATYESIKSAVNDMGSAVNMVDHVAYSAPGNGSRAAIGDDLAAMTKCRMQAKRALPSLEGAGSQPPKRMKRDTVAMPFNFNEEDVGPESVTEGLNNGEGMGPGSGNEGVSNGGDVGPRSGNEGVNKGGDVGPGSGNESVDNGEDVGPGSRTDGCDNGELRSAATLCVKMHKAEMEHELMEEIKEINSRLIDTELILSEEDSPAVSSEGTVIKCVYTAVAISSDLRSHFASAKLSPILPLRLLVPSSYPNSSPIILDKLPEEQRDFDDLSTKARCRFKTSLRVLSQPMSLKETAHTWDSCARKVILEYAQKIGGGSFSSIYGTWQNCVCA